MKLHVEGEIICTHELFNQYTKVTNIAVPTTYYEVKLQTVVRLNLNFRAETSSEVSIQISIIPDSRRTLPSFKETAVEF